MKVPELGNLFRIGNMKVCGNANLGKIKCRAKPDGLSDKFDCLLLSGHKIDL